MTPEGIRAPTELGTAPCTHSNRTMFSGLQLPNCAEQTFLRDRFHMRYKQWLKALERMGHMVPRNSFFGHSTFPLLDGREEEESVLA